MSSNWLAIETVTLATARLRTVSERIAQICSDAVERGPETANETAQLFSAERVLTEHARLWSEVVPESVLLADQRADRPMPDSVEPLGYPGSDWPRIEAVLEQLRAAVARLADGVNGPEGRPFARVCKLVMFDLDALLANAASAPSRPGSADDPLGVFG